MPYVADAISDITPTSMVSISRQGRDLGKELIGKDGKTTVYR
jgi:hypothetical protein